MNTIRRWLSERRLRRIKAARLSALTAYRQALEAGDTRRQHEMHAMARRITITQLAVELGR